MAAISNIPTYDPFLSSIHNTISIAIGKEADRLIREAQERLAERIPEIIARVGLEVQGLISVDRVGGEIRITILDKGPKA